MIAVIAGDCLGVMNILNTIAFTSAFMSMKFTSRSGQKASLLTNSIFQLPLRSPSHIGRMSQRGPMWHYIVSLDSPSKYSLFAITLPSCNQSINRHAHVLRSLRFALRPNRSRSHDLYVQRYHARQHRRGKSRR